MSPYRWTRATKRTVVIAILAVAALLIYLMWFLIPIVATAALLTYLLIPIVDGLQRRRVHRGLASGFVYLLLLILIAVVPVIAVPALARSAQSIDWRGIAVTLSAGLARFLADTRAIDVAGYTVDLSGLIDPLRQRLEAGSVADLPAVGELLNTLTGWASRALVTVLGFVGTLLLTLFTAFYLTLDMPRIRSGIASYLPRPARPELRVLAMRLSRVWNSFFRGELLLGTIIGTITTVGALIIGLPGALWLGLIAGMLEVVPSIGPVLSAVPAVIVALGQGSNAAWLQGVSQPVYALIVIAMYTVIQQLENNFVVPRVLGDAVGLPAVVVLLGAVAGASLFGVLGIFVAAPVVASVGVLLRYTHNKLLDQWPFEGMTLSAAERRAAEEAGLLTADALPRAPLGELLLEQPAAERAHEHQDADHDEDASEHEPEQQERDPQRQ